ANMARFSPFLPLIGGGETKFQPVFVGDLAEAIARSVNGKVAGGKIYELGGPEALTFRECMERILETTGRKRFLVHVPWWLAGIQARILGLLPKPLLTPDQVTQLRHNNVVSEKAIKDNRTFAGIGLKPTSLEAILPSYLWRYRSAGQFTPKSREA